MKPDCHLPRMDRVLPGSAPYPAFRYVRTRWDEEKGAMVREGELFVLAKLNYSFVWNLREVRFAEKPRNYVQLFQGAPPVATPIEQISISMDLALQGIQAVRMAEKAALAADRMRRIANGVGDPFGFAPMLAAHHLVRHASEEEIDSVRGGYTAPDGSFVHTFDQVELGSPERTLLLFADGEARVTLTPDEYDYVIDAYHAQLNTPL